MDYAAVESAVCAEDRKDHPFPSGEGHNERACGSKTEVEEEDPAAY